MRAGRRAPALPASTLVPTLTTTVWARAITSWRTGSSMMNRSRWKVAVANPSDAAVGFLTVNEAASGVNHRGAAGVNPSSQSRSPNPEVCNNHQGLFDRANEGVYTWTELKG